MSIYSLAHLRPIKGPSPGHQGPPGLPRGPLNSGEAAAGAGAAAARFPGTPQPLSRCRGGGFPVVSSQEHSRGGRDGTLGRGSVGSRSQNKPERGRRRPRCCGAEASCRQGLSGAHPSPGGHGHGLPAGPPAPRACHCNGRARRDERGVGPVGCGKRETRRGGRTRTRASSPGRGGGWAAGAERHKGPESIYGNPKPRRLR